MSHLAGGKEARLTSFHTQREVRDERGRFISLQGLTTHSEEEGDYASFRKESKIVANDGTKKRGRKQSLLRQQTIDVISLAKMSTVVSFSFFYYVSL